MLWSGSVAGEMGLAGPPFPLGDDRCWRFAGRLRDGSWRGLVNREMGQARLVNVRLVVEPAESFMRQGQGIVHKKVRTGVQANAYCSSPTIRSNATLVILDSSVDSISEVVFLPRITHA